MGGKSAHHGSSCDSKYLVTSRQSFSVSLIKRNYRWSESTLLLARDESLASCEFLNIENNDVVARVGIFRAFSYFLKANLSAGTFAAKESASKKVSKGEGERDFPVAPT